jgi:hypothetical protein
MSKSCILIVVLLLLGTALLFWSEHQETERRYAEIERQNRVAEKVYHAIQRYADSPSGLTEHEAQVALDLASEEKLTDARQALLSNFYRSAKRCHLDGKYSGTAQDCRKMSYNRLSATTAAISEDLDLSTN